MATSGGQPGNQNAANGKLWQAAILRAVQNRSRLAKKEALDALAEKLLAKCDEGDLQALKEFGDRVDGKPGQAVALTGAGGGPLQFQEVVRKIVDSRNPDA